MNQKELTKTFMMISKWTKPFGLHGLYKIIQRCKCLTARHHIAPLGRLMDQMLSVKSVSDNSQNTRRQSNAGLMLAHRQRRWSSINPALDWRLVFPWYWLLHVTAIKIIFPTHRNTLLILKRGPCYLKNWPKNIALWSYRTDFRLST